MKKNLLDGLRRSVIVVETLQTCNYIFFCVRKIIHNGNHILGYIFTNVLRNQGLLTMQLRKEVPGIAPTKSQPVEGGHTLHTYAKFHFRYGYRLLNADCLPYVVSIDLSLGSKKLKLNVLKCIGLGLSSLSCMWHLIVRN